MADERWIDIASANYPLVEELYAQYKKDPKSVDPKWIDVFKALELESIEEKTLISSSLNPPSQECQIVALIDAYRKWGYLAAEVNPIGLALKEPPFQLNLKNFGLSKEDLSKEFPTHGIMRAEQASLAEILHVLKTIYAGRIGFEYKERIDLNFEKWMQERLETKTPLIDPRMEQKQMTLEQLNKSELFESFLHTRFPGQKRFSLEGAETLIPMLSEIIEKGAILGASEFVLGMTHRGRLNVLSNILNKSYTEVFSEFEEGYFPDSFEGSGDVKYHKGFLSDAISVHGHEIKISLTPNPSHLESVDPVVEGQVKAKQIKQKDHHCNHVIPILTHGDAAIAGQGVVYETLQLSQLEGYKTGGTIHIVINNQIGFTTTAEEARSTPFCTDIAKTFAMPVFHVNAEDPDACVMAAEMAMEVRHLFHRDVFIELNCYRKYGHNESDEPAFTQPLEYKLIRSKKSIRELYRDHLIHEGVVEKFMAEGIEAEFKKALHEAGRAVIIPENPHEKYFSYKRPQDFFTPQETFISKKDLQAIAEKACTIPKEFKIHPKLDQLYKDRLKMVLDEDKSVDWAMGEFLSLASLLWQGVHVRLSGQDSGRGTFSHRHALLHDQVIEKAYYPLSHLKVSQGRSDIINSPLSEFAALGFEYGYSIAAPDALVIWEAQFGDFGNGAQVIIDQYITAADVKWGQKSSLVLLLPHGYEGQGPEHSSARLERFLSLAGNDNLYICNPTTPAQFFHLLRRQAFGNYKKPLICLTPKSLLRSPLCLSPLADFEQGSFEEVLDHSENSKDAKRLIFCSGKIFYDLLQVKQKEKMKDIALIRIEQLYPLYIDKLVALIDHYKKAKEFVWAQEEPANMGAWGYIHPLLASLLPKSSHLEYAGREQSASVASGSYVLHKKEFAALIQGALKPKINPSIEVAHFHRA